MSVKRRIDTRSLKTHVANTTQVGTKTVPKTIPKTATLTVTNTVTQNASSVTLTVTKISTSVTDSDIQVGCPSTRIGIRRLKRSGDGRESTRSGAPEERKAPLEAPLEALELALF